MKVILIIVLFYLKMSISLVDDQLTLQECPPERFISKNGIPLEWPNITNRANDESKFFISDPPCFIKDDVYLVRKCTKEKGWQPNVQRTKCHVPIKSSYCPHDFQTFAIDDEHYCVKVSESKEPWNSRSCYGTNNQIIYDLKRDERKVIFSYYRNKYNATEFWLPAQRAQDAVKFSPVVWKLPGKKWGNLFKVEHNELSHKRCIIAVIADEKIKSVEMTNCYDKHYNLCIFKKTTDYNSVCPDFWYNRIDNPSICYGTEKNKSFGVQQQHYSQNYSGNRIFVETLSQQNVESTIIVYDNKNPEILNSISKGFLNQITIMPVKTVRMFLQFNAEHETLILTVYNRQDLYRNHKEEDDDEFGIKCFTNADYELVREVKIKKLFWENDSGDKSLFKLKMYGDGPGHYWCDAHTIYEFKLIQSPKIVATKSTKGYSFAFFYDLPCKSVDCNRIHKNLKKYAKKIERTLKFIIRERNLEFMKIHHINIMNIESIQTGIELKVLCHAFVSLRNTRTKDSSEESDENDEIPNITGTTFTNTKIQLRNGLNQILSYAMTSKKYYVNSTDFCLPESPTKWRIAKLGTTTTTKELCLMRNGLPVSRKCIGDFLYGAIWETSDENYKCIQQLTKNIITDKLFQMERFRAAKSEPSKTLKIINELIVENSLQQLIPADLYYLGRILYGIKKQVLKYHKSRNTSNGTILNGLNQENDSVVFASATQQITDTMLNLFNNTLDIVNIYNYLMDVNINIIQPSITLNSTNILLDSFESLIDEITTAQIDADADADNKFNEFTNYTNDYDFNLQNGIFTHISSNLMIFTIDPLLSNVSGVGIYMRNQTAEVGSFLDCDYRFVNKYELKEEFLEQEGLEIGAFVPNSLLERLGEIEITSNSTLVGEKPSPKIVIKIYRNDHLFVEDRNVTDKKVRNMIISISIPNYERDLPELLPIYLRTSDDSDNDTVKSCRYWNYNTWAEDGLEFLGKSVTNENLIMCGCSHLTPFAYLVGGTYNLSVSSDDLVIITQIHHEALDIITLLGCSLSLMGVLGIFVTAVTFRSWREKPSTKVLLQLSAAIALQMVFFCFVNTEVLAAYLIENEIFSSCIAMGAALHYFLLVQFCWMLIIAYLQYKRYVQVLGNARPTRFFIKSFLFGWGAPLIPVILVLVFDREAYVPDEGLTSSMICYPSGLALYYSIMMPIAIIIISNFVIFVIVIYNLIRGPDGAIRHTEKKLAISQLRLLILLFFLLGLTWIFGFLSTMKAGLVFSYLFCLTATFQGFVLFIYFVILDPLTRKLWFDCISRLFGHDNKSLK